MKSTALWCLIAVTSLLIVTAVADEDKSGETSSDNNVTIGLTELAWMAGIHVVFLGSMLIAAISDRIAVKSIPLEDGAYAKRKSPAPEADSH